ncbi:MAG: hypothetical protein RMY35_035335 [Nostoc sp. DedSLP01]|nr:hypothetical protein [Nostoc sp. DedSLP05]MDZ8097152.1 hypothetical protein [Nostoc sp. DedSLP01]
MLASFYQNFLEKYLKYCTVNHPKDVGVVTTESETGKDRKAGSNITITNTTK